ncbi:MAG: helix-turn-helix domain-containing protein [Umezawaea sp.]
MARNHVRPDAGHRTHPPVPVVDLAGRDEAVARAERIRTGIESLAALQEDIAAAFHRRDWTALGYDSWETYLDGEFGERRLKLSREQRRDIVASLRGDGLSTRAIGAALGVDHTTVHRDLSTVANPTVGEVTGLDGRTFPTSAPDTAPAPDEPAEPEPPPEQPRRRPLTEDAAEAARALDAAIRRWERLLADDRWATNQARVNSGCAWAFNRATDVLTTIKGDTTP